MVNYKKVAAAIVGVSMLVPVLAMAQTTTPTSTVATQIANLLAQLRALQEQIADLQAQQATLRTEVRETIQLTRTLVRGASGADVEELQKLLASDSEIYPEGLITGFFGPLTEAAIRRFQERFGIEQVGTVGPITRGTLNKLFGKLNSGRGSLNRGPGNIFDRLEIDDDDVEDSDVDLSEHVPGTKGIKVCHIPPGNPAAAHTIAVGGPAVQAHLKHGDALGACDNSGQSEDDDQDEDNDEDTDDDTSDTTAPTISGLEVSSVASTSATVSWTTIEASKGTVYYDTTPIDTDSAPSEDSSTLTTSHAFDLTGLTASTMYHVLVESEDAANNTATSSTSFTTSE